MVGSPNLGSHRPEIACIPDSESAVVSEQANPNKRQDKKKDLGSVQLVHLIISIY